MFIRNNTYLIKGSGNVLEETLSSVTKVICNINWVIKEGESNISGIEHPGIHMTLKKLAQHDKVASENENPTFGKILVDSLTDEVVSISLQMKSYFKKNYLNISF